MAPAQSCLQHSHLAEVIHEELVQPGDTFASPAAFLDYTNARGEKWMFYFYIISSRNYKEITEKKTPSIIFSCSFSAKSCPKDKGIRKRRKYKTRCPCRVIMKRVQGENNNYFKVKDVCYHHDHELSPAMLANLPPRYLLSKHYKEMKEEIADLASLDVDNTTIYKYMVDKTGVKFSRKVIDNQIKAMKNQNIQSKFSAANLKSLMLKIKDINERYGPVDKSEKKKQQSITSQISSTDSIKTCTELLEYGKIKKTKDSPLSASEESEECSGRKRVKSTLKTKKNKDCIQKSRLGGSLYDSEVMQSLQCSTVDNNNVSPWSTRHMTGINDPEESSDSSKFVTTDSHDNRNELVSSQVDEDSQTISEIYFEDSDVDNEVEVEDVTDHTTEEQEIHLQYDTDSILQENDCNEPHANTITEDKTTNAQDVMIPAHQEFKVCSETKTTTIICGHNKKVKDNLNKENKCEAVKIPVIKVKSLKSLSKNGSVQEINSQNKITSPKESNGEASKMPVIKIKSLTPITTSSIFNAQNNIPVINMNYFKFNDNRISVKKGENMVIMLNKHGKLVADSGSVLNNTNNASEPKLGSDDVLRDENKLSNIAQEDQRQCVNDPSISPKEIRINPASNRCLPEICDQHADLVEFKHEELVKPGDIFASAAAFLDYTNARGKKWMFYFFIKESVKPRDKPGSRVPYYIFACCFFSKKYTPKDKGLRKRTKYKTNCPCRVVIKKVRGQDHFKVTHVCYHHDHEVSPDTLSHLPHRYLLRMKYKEMKEEIEDLASLKVDTTTIYNYMVDKAGFKFNRYLIKNKIQAMKMNNIQKQFSAAELKSLLLKVKEVNERYGSATKTDTETDQPDTSQTSSEGPSKTYEQLLDYGKTLEAKEQAAKIKRLESMNKPKRIRNRKKRQPPVTKAKEECIKKRKLKRSLKTQESEECKTSRLETSLNTQESVECKKGRLESTLEKISTDTEVMQAVRDLQRSAVDVINISPWSTRHLIGIDDPEELSYPPKVYATTDSHFNGNVLEFYQYDDDLQTVDGGEIFTEELVVGEETEVENTTHHNSDIQEIDGQCGTVVYQDYAILEENDLDECRANIKVDDNNTIAQGNNNTAQDGYTIVQDVTAIVQDVNTNVQDHKAVNEFKKPTDYNELFEAAKHRIESNCAMFSDHYINYVTEARVKKEITNSNVPQECNSQTIEDCKTALQHLNNKPFANQETQVDMTNKEIHILKHQRLNDLIKKLRGDLKNMDGARRRPSTDFHEDVINRHNIDLFIVQPNASSIIENLCTQMSMSVMDMLQNIYSEKAVISKINITDSSTQVNHSTLVYRLINTPSLPERTGDDHYVKQYKEMCSDYLNTCVSLARLVQGLSEENYELKKKVNGEGDNNS